MTEQKVYSLSSQFAELRNLDLSLLGGPMLAEVGKIKIGGKGKQTVSQKGKVFRLPEKYDHFVVTTNFKDISTDRYIPDTELMQKIAEMTKQDPDNLKLIPVTLLFDDPNLNFMVRFSCTGTPSSGAWVMGKRHSGSPGKTPQKGKKLHARVKECCLTMLETTDARCSEGCQSSSEVLKDWAACGYFGRLPGIQ